MDSFSETLQQWAPFFALLGGAVATLIGLLFVAVSINLSIIMNRTELRSQAVLTFSSFVFLLEISIYSLVPQDSQYIYGTVLTFFALFNLSVGVRQAMSARHHMTKERVGSALVVIIPLAIAAVAGILIYFGDPTMLYALLGAALTILIASVSSAWGLLVEVSADEGSGESARARS